MKTIKYNRNTDTPVILESYSDGTYRVLYGVGEDTGKVSYANASRALGECLMHSASCAGLLD